MMPSWSPYNYTFGSPLNYTDPDGQLPNPIVLLVDALFRNFKPQSTASFLREASRKKFFESGGNIKRIGRIYEDAVIRSLGEVKNTQKFRLALTSPKAVIPDLVGPVGINYFDNTARKVDELVFPQASFVDAKFKSGVQWVDDHNPYQLRDMINVLSNMKGGYVNGKWDPNIKPSTYGAASLTLITPGNTVIDPGLIEYATSKNVHLFQRTTEQEQSEGDRIRVAPNVIPLNTVGTGQAVPVIL